MLSDLYNILFPVVQIPSNGTESSNSGLSGGAIAGITIGTIVGVILILACIYIIILIIINVDEHYR